MDTDLEQRLIASMQQNRLLVFCGAGLSRSLPSKVPGANDLANQCAHEYGNRSLPVQIPAGLQSNLEALTEFLFEEGLHSFFIRDLVDWRPFRRNPNRGHLAIADLLTCGAANAGITTNFDELIELAAMELGEDTFEAALNLQGANQNRPHRPLLKIHGCVRDKDYTLWCRNQLQGPPPPVEVVNGEVQNRLSSCQTWLAATLPEKDLIFIGFWSDWAYLTPLMTGFLTGVHAPLVVLVDPGTPEFLTSKAPELSNWARANGNRFYHVRETGEKFLEDLRNAFSRNLLSRVLRDALPGFRTLKPGVADPAHGFADLQTDDLFSLRRDVCGVSAIRIPRASAPDASMDEVGRAHLLLRHAGATIQGSSYVTAQGRRVRVVNGKTKVLSKVKQQFMEEPSSSAIANDYVVCAGSFDDGGVQANIVRGSDQATIVRSGTSADWIGLETAMEMNLL